MELTEVTGENWKQAVFLTTDPERKIPLDEKWIISNAFSLLQARYDPNWDCRLLVDGETPVGFAFYGYWQERDRYLLCRYMIDVRYQGRPAGGGTNPAPVRMPGCVYHRGRRKHQGGEAVPELWIPADGGNG
ncbi:MAG: hypothetical protein BHW33_06435 [Firmicutes bacterium CAG:137_57_8]|nr:MAG: hypothetical protein BHW33_06435 [Firmicutes bacterium CAG:137_57_8]